MKQEKERVMKKINKIRKKVNIQKYLLIKRTKLKLHIIKDFLKSKNKLKNIKKYIIKKSKNALSRYLNSENHIKFIINSILSSRIVILLLFLIIMFKSNLFYQNINLPEDSMDRTIMMTVRFLCVMICPLLFIKKDKNRFLGIMIYDVVISILLFVDNVYFEYSANLLSISQILYVKYAEEIRRNVAILTTSKSNIIFC